MKVDSLFAWLAIGLGLGHVPLLPGTAGAIAGVLPAMGFGRLRRGVRLALTAAFVALAVPICEYGARGLEGSDNPRIVADELFAFPVATVVLPIHRHPALLAGVFVTSRVLDGLKPPPARAAEQLQGGMGIVLDDVVTNLWTLVLWLIGWRWWCRRSSRSVTKSKK
jgi:phosphatidylglycerophosphatase A